MSAVLRNRRWRPALWGTVLVVCSVCLFPYLIMLLTALKPDSELTGPQHWLPDTWEWRNLIDVWTETTVLTNLKNSSIIAGGVTAVVLLCAVPAAYAFARFKFTGQRAFLDVILITQMMSPIIVLIPLFKTLASFDLLGTYWSVIVVSSAFILPFSIWLLVGFFRTVSREIEEAATLDGCSRLEILFRVILPIARPGLAATAVYAFLYGWNEFIISLTFLSSAEEKWPITIGVFLNVGQWYVDWQFLMLMAVIGTLPVLALFLLVQRQLDRGFATLQGG